MRAEPNWESKWTEILFVNRDLCILLLLDKLEIFVRADGQRGVRAKTSFGPGQFVLEFEANLLSEDESREAEEYQQQGKPVNTLEVCTFYL